MSDRRSRTVRPRRRSRTDDNTALILILVGVGILAVSGVVAVAVLRSRPADEVAPPAVAAPVPPAPVVLPPLAVPPPIVAVPVVRPPLPAGWIDWQPPGKLFSVYLPSTPRPFPEPAAPDGVQKSTWACMVPHGNSVWGAAVSVITLPPDAAADFALPPFPPGQPIAVQNELVWNGHLATEYIIRGAGGGLHTVRLCRVGNRAFLATVQSVGPGVPTDAERDAVLDSFVVAPQ